MDETVQSQDPAASPRDTAENGSKQQSDEEQLSSPAIVIERSGQPPTHKGPRTPKGKENSKHNALRHGIFSSVTVLAGESSDEYESLLEGLSDALQPDNTLETLLVEKLATLSWRHRRMLQAEVAEIQQGSEFLEWDQKMRYSHEAEMTKRRIPRVFKTHVDRPCLIPEIQNPEVLEHCLKLLLDLQKEITSRGFSKDRDGSILAAIYGSSEGLHGTLLRSYSVYRATASAPEEERQRNGYATPEACKNRILSEIAVEIQRLRDFRQEQAEKESERTKLEILRRKIPESAKLDRLLRYETSLERSFDRTLTQLERAQRVRKGQPLPPQLDIKIS
jgi:hypothetical protein